MAAPNILWCGGEDSDFVVTGTNHGVDTTAGHYRSAYARCGVSIPNGNTGTSINLDFYSVVNEFSTSRFWWSTWIYTAGGTTINNGEHFFRFTDAAGIVRIRLRVTGDNTTFPGIVYTAETVNAAGAVVTTLGTLSFVQSNGALGKIDVFVNYSSSGQFTVYNGGIPIFNYTGTLLTDANTTINGFDLGCFQNFPTSGGPCAWSELIVCDSDTRSYSLQTFPPVANGNTHTFDTGSPAAANVNEVTLNDSTIDASTTAGQIDEYTIGSLAAGTYSIIGFEVSARLQIGSSGPAHMDLGVRSGASPTDYWSSNFAPGTAWGPFQNVWTTDPSTSAAWLTLPVNIGLQSVV